MYDQNAIEKTGLTAGFFYGDLFLRPFLCCLLLTGSSYRALLNGLFLTAFSYRPFPNDLFSAVFFYDLFAKASQHRGLCKAGCVMQIKNCEL